VSWVIVGETHAWKIKKPLRLPFLDYSTLEKRREACEAELEVNRRFAPDLYEGVEAISGPPDSPGFGEPARAIEYAVRMRRFEEAQLFSNLLARSALPGDVVDALARYVAGFQERAPRAQQAQRMALPSMRASFAQAALHGAQDALGSAAYGHLRRWLAREAARLEDLWAARARAGFVREGHGDLHLANVLRLDDGSVLAFDALEFDARLRWIDTLDDAAFAFMDFAARGRPDFAYRFLNRWLDANGDHEALRSMRFSACYRALVRCGAQAMRGRRQEARVYARNAVEWTRAAAPHLVIMHGLPGSGKTTRARARALAMGAIHLRSDVERKRLFGLGELDSSAALGRGIYGEPATAATYAKLFEAASSALRGGFPVILDAAFPAHAQRDRARELARESGARFTIIPCDAPVKVLARRIAQRTGDASEADGDVLRHAMATRESLTPDEWTFVENMDEFEVPALAAA
jgi:aminoglycoside phosphotransferase family enzyme/predicted kinase